MTQEIWKDIPGYEGIYQASTEGKIKSLKFGKEKILKSIIILGYFIVNLCKNGKTKSFAVHQLVAMTFLNHKPDGHKLVIDHLDSDKLNNRVQNLRIVTNRENCSKEKTQKRGLPVGVYWIPRLNKWISKIQINSKLKHLGYFNTIEEASEAYQKALKNTNLIKYV